MKTLIGMVLLAVLAGCETAPKQVLAYVQAGKGGLDLYLYDLEAGSSIQLQQTHGIDEYDPALDYNAQRLAYVARQRSADTDAYTLRIHGLETGTTQDLLRSDEPLFSPAFSNNGKKLAYVVLRDGKLQVDVRDLTTESQPKTIGFGSDPSWRIDDRAVFFSSRDTIDAPSGDLMVHELKTGVNQSFALRGNAFANLPRATSVAYTTLPYTRRNEAVWLLTATSRQQRLTSPGKTHRDTHPVHINGSKFVAFTRTDVATNRSSIFVVQRYAEDPVETRLFEATGNTSTSGRELLDR